MSNYKNQYKSPKWQKKRLEILERDNYTCQYCGDKESQLHVHHKFYLYGVDIWDYPYNNVYITLCEYCHELAHNKMDMLNQTLAFIDYSVIIEYSTKDLNKLINALIALQLKNK